MTGIVGYPYICTSCLRERLFDKPPESAECPSCGEWGLTRND